MKDLPLGNGQVNIDLIPFLLPPDLLLTLKGTPIHRFGSREGKRIWLDSLNGDFNNKSAYFLASEDHLSMSEEPLHFDKWIWKVTMCPKIKFFL